MVAKSENLNQTEDLMLLTKVGRCSDGGAGGEKRVYRCKTCLKEFSSFQALGGHCTSHIIKPIRNNQDQSSSSSSKKDKPMTSHKCLICGDEFAMGQALGGHMTKHRNDRDKARRGTLVLHSFLPVEPSSNMVTTTILEKLNSESEDSVESYVDLKLELALSIS